MPTLAGIDTTKVYHKFDFDCDQVKDLKLKQYFIHIDAVKWFEKILAKRFRKFNFIKIIYKRLYHFDIKYMKCVEIYYDEHDLKTFQVFKSKMDQLIKDAQNKMPWRSKTIYYVCSEIKLSKFNVSYKTRLKLIETQLQITKLHNCLIKRYKMEVGCYEKRNLTVFQFTSNLDEYQVQGLEDIFIYYYEPSIFISEEFMFLNITDPPKSMNFYVLTVFHRQLFSSLTLEDILSLELANKDYRFEWNNCVLDRDIQVHLQKRFKFLCEHEKLKTYDATEFTNVRVLKYFLYKYRNCFTTVELPNHNFTNQSLSLNAYKTRSLQFSALNNSTNRFEIISPENITVCSVTLLRHNKRNLIEPDYMQIKEIRLDSNTSSNLDDEVLSMIESKSFFIEIKIRAKCKSVYLTDLLHTVLENNIDTRSNFDSIIQLRSYNNRINSFILNSFVEKSYKFEVGFKNIIFQLKRIVKWLSKCTKLTNVSFTDCIFLLNDKDAKMLKTIIKQRKTIDCCSPNLTFRNMNFDIPTFSILSHINRGKIVYDGCYITPSSWMVIPPTSLKTIVCKNMKIDLQVLILLLSNVTFEFDNCEIQSNQGPILQSDSMTRYNSLSFIKMDIDAEVLLNISVYLKYMHLDYCRVLSNEIVNVPSNYPTNFVWIVMTNVDIELKAAAKIYNRFDRVSFTSSRFVCADVAIPKIPVKLNSFQHFSKISITPEFIKVLKNFDLRYHLIFSNCDITNQNLIDIWEAAPRCERISIYNRHLVDYNFYFELVAKIYEHKLDKILHELKDGVAIPLFKLFDIEPNEDPLSNTYIEWRNVLIRSVHVSEGTIKLEYLRTGEVLDIFYEQTNLVNDSDVCEVNYY